jgi:hypothetical protein
VIVWGPLGLPVSVVGVVSASAQAPVSIRESVTRTAMSDKITVFFFIQPPLVFFLSHPNEKCLLVVNKLAPMTRARIEEVKIARGFLHR